MDDRAVVSMSGSELLAAYDSLHDEIAEREARGLQILARLEQVGHAQEIGAHDTARLIAKRYRLDPAEAHRRVRLANALPKYPTVAAALPMPGEPGDGVVLHTAQAAAIVFALEQIPGTANVAVEERVTAEEQMVEAARVMAPGDLRRLGVQVRNILDTDGPEPREDAARERENVWVKRADGGVTFGGFLAGENAEGLETVLQVGAKPHKTVDGAPDSRSRGKRQADALVDALHIALNSGELPRRGGIKPHIAVTIDLFELIEAGKNATGNLMFGDGLSAGAVRRLACDAGIIPMVLGSDSQPLDVGREFRLVTTGLRNALNQRDRGCVVCGAPPIYCDAHHLVSWFEGGDTSLANLVLLCRVHHTAIHRGHWTITIVDNQVEVTHPTWTDRARAAHPRRLTPPTPAAPAPATTATPPCPAAPAPTATPASPPWPPSTTPVTTTTTRSWPHTTDVPWITPEEAAALDPWPETG